LNSDEEQRRGDGIKKGKYGDNRRKKKHEGREKEEPEQRTILYRRVKRIVGPIKRSGKGEGCEESI